MTTVGYGDIKPVTSNEIVVVIFCMGIAVTNFTILLNSISESISKISSDQQHENELYDYCKKHLSKKDIPPQLEKDIDIYFENMQEQDKRKIIGEDEVMTILNETLRNKITLEINTSYLSKF
jgi:hypothetical protein